MEGFDIENESTPDKPEAYPGREAILREATGRAVNAYLERWENAEKGEQGHEFTGENGKAYEVRHTADERVLEMGQRLETARAMVGEAIANNDPHAEGLARVLEEMNRNFERGLRRLAELYDNNPEAARRLAAALPDMRDV